MGTDRNPARKHCHFPITREHSPRPASRFESTLLAGLLILIPSYRMGGRRTVLRETWSGRLLNPLLIVFLVLTAGWLRSEGPPLKTGALYQVRRRAAAKAERDARPATTCGGELNVGF